MATTKRKSTRYRIQYRCSGSWQNGNAYDTRKEAEDYAKRTGRDYQIVEVR